MNDPYSQNSQVCQTVIDLHEDTVVTENCEEVITTTCTQVSQVRVDHNGDEAENEKGHQVTKSPSQEAHHTSAVVDRSHRLVEEGVPVPYFLLPITFFLGAFSKGRRDLN